MSSSIPSWQILTAHAQTFSGARDLAFCLKAPLDSLLVWASSEGSGETARMRRLAWTFAARTGDKYQITLTRSKWCEYLNNRWFGGNNRISVSEVCQLFISYFVFYLVLRTSCPPPTPILLGIILCRRTKQRPWSDCADTQADLCFCCLHGNITHITGTTKQAIPPLYEYSCSSLWVLVRDEAQRIEL